LLIHFFALQGTCNAQYNNLDSLFNLPSKLVGKYELRIYKGRGITNGGSVFVLRKETDKWEAQLFQYFVPVEKNQKFRFEVKPLAYTSNPDDFWVNVLALKLENLPQEAAFEGRKSYLTIKKVKRYKNKPQDSDGSDIEFYHSKTIITDGKSYDVKFRNKNVENKFRYHNPEAYLEKFPHIDELVYFCTLLKLI
jgi:hypothetical protein